MIPRTDLAALSPDQRARLIYADAQSQLASRLWRAALGDADRNDRDTSPLGANNIASDSLMQLIGGTVEARGCNCGCACSCHQRGGQAAAMMPTDDSCIENVAGALRVGGGTANAFGIASKAFATASTVAPIKQALPGVLSLGPNARFESAFAAASARTGIPASALAAIVDAEAGKNHDGSWNAMSRNPRSSAAGLGQFLSGTWQNLAQTQGTWLNQLAAARGWLDSHGNVQSAARADLLALRYDPEASILAVADLAKGNLDRLEQSGVRVRTDAETLAKSAYLSHHLGLGDARKFLAGGIEPGRARMLLSAQIGSAAAEQRIAAAGDASQAHRQWLLGFIEKRINPQQFGG